MNGSPTITTKVTGRKSNSGPYNLLRGQLRNGDNSRMSAQRVSETNMVNDAMPHWKMFLAYSAKQPGNNVTRNKKSKLYIKNMVSIRCEMAVEAVLESIGLHCTHIELGSVEITDNLSEIKRNELKAGLLRFGLELMDNKNHILIEKIKNVVIEMVHYADELPQIKFSCYLSEKLNHKYAFLANLFSELTGSTIKQFIIMHKIERIKELLDYNELTIDEIADRLHYSSAAHLSSQFKKITGLTPSHFKNLKNKRRIALENL